MSFIDIYIEREREREREREKIIKEGIFYLSSYTQ